MKSEILSRSKQTSKAWRIAIPLLIWIFVMALLWAHKKHGELSERTYLTFSSTLNSSRAWEAKATIDGNEIESGGKVSVGSHIFSVSHPKAEAFSKKVFVWYGENKLGEIPLTRSKGSITIRANPPAPTITIRGPEFTASYNDISETNITIATDRYQVEARYRNWNKKTELLVVSDSAKTVNFAPSFGAVRIVASYPHVSFTLSQPNGDVSEQGSLPYEGTSLPAGKYQLVAKHRNNRRETTVEVRTGKTNEIQIEFVYGAALLKTAPLGATVVNREDQILGTTPLLLTELEPGDWTFVLRRDGYEPISANVKVLPYSTNEFQAKLVNAKYAEAIRAARNYLDSEQFNLAYEAANAALALDGSDNVALGLKRKASGFENLRLARMFARDGDYTAALKKVQSAMAELPENSEVKTLLEEYKAGEQKAWLNRGNKVFETILSQYDGANLFEKYQSTTQKPVYEVEHEVANLFKTGDPVYLVTSLNNSVPESFSIKASYTMPLLSLKSGRRDVIIVGTQKQTNETEILFKILEYKPDVNKPITEIAHLTYVPIHPSRIGAVPGRLQTQLREGIADVTARIKRAIE